MNIEFLQQWVGRSEDRVDEVSVVPAMALADTLYDSTTDLRIGATLPPLWHWLYFLPRAARADIGLDGHPKRGGFLPPIELPRRMWAGGRLEYAGPLKVGDSIERKSQLESVTAKSGRGGELVFVTIRHEIFTPRGLALTEWQDIVYRSDPSVPSNLPGRPPASSAEQTEKSKTVDGDADWVHKWHADPVLLFRYSALTFNSHRIHYDRNYATEKEGYPGLVVHGPLMATLLAELVRMHVPGTSICRFRFRGMRPVFDLHPFEACGIRKPGHRSAELFIRNHENSITMEAEAELAD